MSSEVEPGGSGGSSFCSMLASGGPDTPDPDTPLIWVIVAERDREDGD
jgi:hypothetical protein